MEWIAALAWLYLLGSIPFGLLLTRLPALGDIRTIGSGNIGATNVLRTGSKGLAAATLLLDVAQGRRRRADRLARSGGETRGAGRGVGAVLGHCFPVWLGFKGGKGVGDADWAFRSASPGRSGWSTPRSGSACWRWRGSRRSLG